MATRAFADTLAPPLSLRVQEFGSIAVLRWKTLRTADRACVGQRGAPVLVIPGFMASDHSTKVMRSGLVARGFRAHGWGLGFNWGAGADLFERLDGALDRATRYGKVSVVGWSLGGVYARELAKRRPDDVARVITLGTPFSGDPRANNGWRLYELVNRHPVDAPPVSVRVHEKPPVPTIAFWSRRDGMVAPASARGLPGETDASIELDCTHAGFMTAPSVIAAVAAQLAPPYAAPSY